MKPTCNSSFFFSFLFFLFTVITRLLSSISQRRAKKHDFGPFFFHATVPNHIKLPLRAQSAHLFWPKLVLIIKVDEQVDGGVKFRSFSAQNTRTRARERCVKDAWTGEPRINWAHGCGLLLTYICIIYRKDEFITDVYGGATAGATEEPCGLKCEELVRNGEKKIFQFSISIIMFKCICVSQWFDLILTIPAVVFCLIMWN